MIRAGGSRTIFLYASQGELKLKLKPVGLEVTAGYSAVDVSTSRLHVMSPGALMSWLRGLFGLHTANQVGRRQKTSELRDVGDVQEKIHGKVR